MTRFWIMELAGRKLVRMVPPSENWRGEPTDVDAFQPLLFTVDLMDPDFVQHPHLDGMLIYETILEPGDILFIPEGWGHQALNLEWSLMISSNYIDQHNAPLYLEYQHFDVRLGGALTVALSCMQIAALQKGLLRNRRGLLYCCGP